MAARPFWGKSYTYYSKVMCTQLGTAVILPVAAWTEGADNDEMQYKMIPVSFTVVE